MRSKLMGHLIEIYVVISSGGPLSKVVVDLCLKEPQLVQK